MAQIELSVLRELQTSTREHKIQWEGSVQNGHYEWAADVGTYAFCLIQDGGETPSLRIEFDKEEVAVIDGPEVTSLLRSIKEESKAWELEQKKQRLNQVLATLETHRASDRGAFFLRS